MKLFNIALMATLLCSQSVWAAKASPKGKKAPASSQNSKGKLPTVQIANDGMTIMYGNTLIERLQEEGTFEALMQASTPEEKVQFRSLAYMGDRVDFRIRASQFGTHLDYLVKQWPADHLGVVKMF